MLCSLAKLLLVSELHEGLEEYLPSYLPCSLGVEPGDSGGVAQLGERLPCTQEVIGSIPFTSTMTTVKSYELKVLKLLTHNF